MAYILDLTLVMQNVFCFVAIKQVPISCRLVKLTRDAYKKSIVMPNVQEEIKKHVEGQTARDHLHRDSSALIKILSC